MPQVPVQNILKLVFVDSDLITHDVAVLVSQPIMIRLQIILQECVLDYGAVELQLVGPIRAPRRRLRVAEYIESALISLPNQIGILTRLAERFGRIRFARGFSRPVQSDKELPTKTIKARLATAVDRIRTIFAALTFGVVLKADIRW